MLGGAVAARLSAAGVGFVPTDIELDLTEGKKVTEFARDHGFTHIVNCAGYTDVDGAESEPERATAVNAAGPENLARAASLVAAVLVHFSTDYVFGGNGNRPYLEEDPCAPINAYGRSKLEGERRLLSAARAAGKTDPGLYLLRTSWLFGEGGKNFVSTMLSLFRKRDRVQVVSDQTGRPTYSRDLAAAALALAGLPGGDDASPLPGRPVPSGVFHYANAGRTSWHQFAETILRSARDKGFPVRTSSVEPVPTSAFPRPAARPAYSVLSTERIASLLGRRPRPWQEALDEYLEMVKLTVQGEIPNTP
jgi:dTDP-4-dehydrorhamnose reductase